MWAVKPQPFRTAHPYVIGMAFNTYPFVKKEDHEKYTQTAVPSSMQIMIQVTFFAAHDAI